MHCPTAPTLAGDRDPDRLDRPQVGTFHSTGAAQRCRTSSSRLLARAGREARRAHRGLDDRARDSAELYYPGQYDVIPNGVDMERFHPLVAPVPGVARPEPREHPVRRPARSAQGRAGPDQRHARGGRAHRRPRAAAGRGRFLPAPADRGVGRRRRAAARALPRPRAQRRPAALVRDRRRLRLARDRQRELRHRAGRGHGGGPRGGVLRHPGLPLGGDPGENAACFPPGDGARSRARSRAGATIPSGAGRLAAAGRLRSLEFAWPRVIDRIEAVYREPCGHHRAALRALRRLSAHEPAAEPARRPPTAPAAAAARFRRRCGGAS